VITDQHVYSFPVAATVTATVGDTVYAGDTLVDDIEIIELAGNSPDYTSVPAISVGKQFLTGGYYGELVFENKSVSLVYSGLDADGRAVATFELSGFPADVAQFWIDVQTRGKQAGMQTLAEMLDTRENPTVEPTAEYLPATINPVQFLIENFFANNMFLIRLNRSAFPSNAPGISCLRHLRNMLPPHITYLIFIELAPTLEEIDLSESTDAPGIYHALPVTTSVVNCSGAGDPGIVEVHARVWPVSLTCN